ncbi:MAG TPA: TonB-dependent receptor [Cyclobacteriaceae bacterium]
MKKHYRLLVVALLACLIAGSAKAQEVVVNGKVLDAADGSALPGVNILEKGTTNGALSNGDGEFTIKTKKGSVLVLSFVGYTPQEITVGDQTSINVSLQADITQLSEIVVVGYGEVQKKDATGAVANISAKDFNRGVLTSPQDLMLGKIAGVSITSNSGAPGSNSTIRIRGGSSLSASNDPLIVIDGFPVDNGANNTSGTNSYAGVSNPLATLNPNDIETFTVLKDASATAIYGSRASNGVIIITTKKGKSGKPQFSYNGNVSVSSPIKYMDVLNGDEYRALVKQLAATGVSGLNAEAVSELGTANTNWQKEIYRNAISHDHNISASGTYKRLPYRVSYGYTDQQGILKTTGLQRNSLNVSLTPSLLQDHLKLTINAKGSRVNNNFGETGAIGNAITFDPTKPVRDSNSKYGGYYSWLNENNNYNGTDNPVAQLNQTSNTSVAKRVIGNIQAEYKFHFLPALKLNVNAGLDHSTSDGRNVAGTNAMFTKVVEDLKSPTTGKDTTVATVVGRNNTYSATNKSELLDIYLNYAKEFGAHKIDFTAGYGWQHFYREGASRNSSTDGSRVTVPPPFKNENFLVSFFGRLNYTLKGKYLLTATLRDDGSSRFAKANRWGLFPAVSLAWRLKDESFLTNVDLVSDLKLRAGYGVTGQQDLTNNQYPYLAVYRASTATAQYQFGNTFYTTLRPEAYDPNIKWESTATYNLGLDFGFFNDKITGSVELYQRKTSDLLNYISVANGSAFSNYLNTNVGNLENKGVEISLRAIPISTKDLTWNFGFNFTHNVNKVTKLLLVKDPSYPGVYSGNVGVGANVQNSQIGYPVNSFYVYQQIYNTSGKPIEGLYVDRTGQGGTVTNNENNKYRYQKPSANILMGVNSRVNYKKFDFSFSGRISLGNYVYNNNLGSRAFYNRIYNLNFFSNVPSAINETKFVSQQTYSDYYVQNASFFKMDNMSLGYNMDKFFSEKIKARISLTAQNAFIITKYKGMDPEVDGGIDNNIYPRPRTFLLGVNLTF